MSATRRPDLPLYLLIHSDHPLDPLGPNSGAEMASLNQARALARSGRTVCLAARLKQPITIDQGVTFIDLGPTYDIERALDWADAQGPYVLLAAGKAFALLLSRRRTNCIKRVLITHDRSAGDSGLRPDLLEHVCDHILCVSNAQRDKLALEGAPVKRMTVIHNGVDFEIFKPSPPERHDATRLIFSGALVPDKGLHLLIGAFINLKPRYPKLELDVFGSSSLWSRADYLNIDELKEVLPELRFHGSVSQREAANALATAGICVVPSIWFDPFPLTSLEAQACGTPVVAFNVGGLAEGIAHNSTGCIVDEISQTALTLMLDSLLSDPKRLHFMSENCTSWITQRFSWEGVISKIIALCELPT